MTMAPHTNGVRGVDYLAEERGIFGGGFPVFPRVRLTLRCLSLSLSNWRGLGHLLDLGTLVRTALLGR